MPRIFEAIGRGIAGAGRAIRGGIQGGAAQATPTPPIDERVEVHGTESGRPRSPLQRFGSKIKRDAENAPFARGIRALRSRAVKRRTAARGTR